MTVYLCDANIWLALALEPHVHHRASLEWFDGVEAASSLMFCRATQQALLRLLTTGAVMRPYGLDPLSNVNAWNAYQEFATDSRVLPPGPEPKGLEHAWLTFALRPDASPKLWMDAYLAAFASASSMTMVTTDQAYRQFDGLDLELIAE